MSIEENRQKIDALIPGEHPPFSQWPYDTMSALKAATGLTVYGGRSDEFLRFVGIKPLLALMRSTQEGSDYETLQSVNPYTLQKGPYVASYAEAAEALAQFQKVELEEITDLTRRLYNKNGRQHTNIEFVRWATEDDFNRLSFSN